MSSNQILITLDSVRWDVFEKANLPFLKSGKYEKCWGQATFTMAAHHAYFAGKLPHNYNGNKYFDFAATPLRNTHPQVWRLANPESRRPALMHLNGKNIKHGFQNIGYTTIGTGAMNWFDPAKPAAGSLLTDFDHYEYFANAQTGDGRNSKKQINWVLETLKTIKTPYFLFINLGETHHRFIADGHELSAEWGDREGCLTAQQASLEYLDSELARLFNNLNNYTAVICADHGDAFGEDGLWGHGFYHPKVMEIPMVIKRTDTNLVKNIKEKFLK